MDTTETAAAAAAAESDTEAAPPADDKTSPDLLSKSLPSSNVEAFWKQAWPILVENGWSKVCFFLCCFVWLYSY